MIVSVSSRVSSPYLVGRSEDLDRLRAAYTRASSGVPTTVLVDGEAGVGKTRLIEELVGGLRATSAPVLIGGCMDLGVDGLPFAPFVDAFRALARELDPDELDHLLGPGRGDLGRLMPGLAGGAPRLTAEDEAVAQARLFEHVLGLLARLSDDQPLLLVLEDLHWADRSTRDLVRFLVRSLRRERVVLVLTYRSDDLHRRHPLLPLLSDLARLQSVESITLERLDRDETSALLGGILEAEPTAGLVEDLFARSDGNPFFVEELVAFGGKPAEAIPTTIREIVGVRVGRLPEPSQSVLRIAAVVGRRVDHELLARLADDDADALVERIKPAVDARLVLATDDGDGAVYEFRHALVPEALYDELLPAERTSLHARLAEILEARRLDGGRRRPSQAEIAHHWSRAYDLARALESSARAAEEAADLAAYAEVKAQLERVLELWSGQPDAEALAGMDRAEVLQRAADAAAAIGEYKRAIALGREVLAEIDMERSADRWLEASHRLAWYQWDHGDAAGAEETVQAARPVGERASAVSNARLLTDVAQVHWSAARFSDQAEAAGAALELALTGRHPIEEAQARMMLGVGQASLGDIAPGLQELERALAALDDGPEDLRALAAVELQHALNIAGLYERSVALGYREIERLRANGLFRRFSAYIGTDLVDGLIEMGRWAEASTVLQDPDWPRDGSRASAWMFGDTAELASLHGDVERARSAIGEAQDRVSPSDAAVDHIWLHRAEGIVALAEARPQDASDAFWSAIAASPDPARNWPLAFWVVMTALSTEADLAEIARATRDRDRERAATERGRHLLAIVDEVAAGAPDPGIPSLRALVALSRAESTRLAGRSDPDAWTTAAQTFDDAGLRYDAAIARYQEGAALLALGTDRERAARVLRDAHGVAVELSARPFRERIEAMATRGRISLEPDTTTTAATPEPAIDPYGLTTREREVLDLVAQGRTNREIGDTLFISEKTASVHVTHILGKFGVSSRVEAALLAARAGMVDDA